MLNNTIKTAFPFKLKVGLFIQILKLIPLNIMILKLSQMINEIHDKLKNEIIIISMKW